MTFERSRDFDRPPLAPEGFRFVYEGIKSDVHLAHLGWHRYRVVLVLGVPTKSVWIGEIRTGVWSRFDDDGEAHG